MKNFLLVFILLLASCSGARQEVAEKISTIRDNLTEQEFVPGTEDVPLMRGFQLLEGQDVAYDSVTGRIVKASYYSNRVAVSDTRGFYAVALPQLGWRKEGDSGYSREGEKLELDISTKQGRTYLEFTIIPQ